MASRKSVQEYREIGGRVFGNMSTVDAAKSTIDERIIETGQFNDMPMFPSETQERGSVYINESLKSQLNVYNTTGLSRNRALK
jgi:hypothetical protein